ncbi:hypothetical protein RLW55_01285 [Hyphomicrobium sp. B1]|uniref:hypothetical protein n=1 Tax=unclassified Hyphomicrobium TaxID=2619925 RepID=UPI00391C09CC
MTNGALLALLLTGGLPLDRLPPSVPPTDAIYCAPWRELDAYMLKYHFVLDETYAFESGAAFLRYRFLADVQWVFRLPNGESCLVAARTARRLPD